MRFFIFINYIIKFIINIFLLSISINVHAENRPGFVCGKFNGNVVEVTRDYVDFIAEYEGYSYFDRRAVKNKKGCDANFTVLPLRMTWPEMKPVDRMGLDQNAEEIKIAVMPMTNNKATMNKFRDNLINSYYWGARSGIYYDDELDLYFVEYLKDEATTYSDEIYQDKYRVYWSEHNDEVISIIDCDWMQSKKEYYLCEVNGRIPEVDAYFNVVIKWKQLTQWESILLKSKKFVINHLK
ncbi:hypothetical protein [Providencia sp. Je.9.19]|uniref:hypothetical protein n=1 Tax=Providencia sp. Je.9.19 TaxID=3142844 RepID=UPI003DA860E6